MNTIIITKWIEPYKLLETIKQDYKYQDFTFDGITKNIEKKKFLNSINKSTNSIGLYMKNVNKYYLFTRNDKFEIFEKLKQTFSLTNSDFEICEDINKTFEKVDLGKAEAGLIIP